MPKRSNAGKDTPSRSEPQSILGRTLSQYLENVESMAGESARSHRFSVLLQDILGVESGFIENYLSGVEKYLKVKQKDSILKGKADNLYGNVIIEFEASILKTLADAEEQLKRYTAIAWSNEKPGARVAYLCIAGDGVRFNTYTPVAANQSADQIAPEDISLNLLEEVDWRKLDYDDIYSGSTATFAERKF